MKKNIMMRLAIVIFVAILFTNGLLFSTFAKYTTEVTFQQSNMGVAAFGSIELYEHKAELKDGVYVLNKEVPPVTENAYENVIPGVKIPKDPYIVLNGKFEVSFAVYVKIVETNCIGMIVYDMTDWTKDTTQKLADGEYVYYKEYRLKDKTGMSFNEVTIRILANDTIRVSQKYVNNGKFSVKFSAWIAQIN